MIGETISSSIGRPANWSAIPAIKFIFLLLIYCNSSYT